MGVFPMTSIGMKCGARNTAEKRLRFLRNGAAVVALGIALGSCAGGMGYNDYDTAGGITKQEYADLLSRRAPEKQIDEAADAPPIPGFQSVLAAPGAPAVADTRRVSLAVTETTPVRDILIELARKAEVDIELDPRISGGIIMTATDRPFIDVIDRIVELAELRYKFIQNTLRVEVDDPYLEQYRMDVLNLSRNASSEVSSSTDASSVAQAIGSGGGGGGSNQSATSVTGQSTSNFWGTIGSNIEQILSGVQSRRGQPARSIDAEFAPEVLDDDESAREGGLVQQAASVAGGRQEQLDSILAEEGGEDPELRASRDGSAPRTAGAVASSQYSLNPQAGIITVFATQRQQRAVERYLRDVRASVTQQVLIEAKVLEVTLSDQYRAGVNWNAVFGPDGELGVSRNDNLNLSTNFARNVVPPDFADPTVSATWMNGGDLSLAVQMVNEFGTVRTLSSPRLTVLNNQVAMLKVAKNQVFFELDVTTTDATSTQAGKTTVESQIKTVPVGIIVNVQPAVDPVSRRISLSLRPSITRITGFINDPGVAVTVAVAQANNPDTPLISSPVPVIEIREMDSIVNLESGQTVVMGGLMQEEVQTTREGLPGFMDVPLLGQAAAQNVKENTVTELVVFIRATLADAPGTVSDEDIRLYKTFTPDPRPLAF